MEKIGCKKTSRAEDIKNIVEHIFQLDVVCISCLQFDICREAKEVADAEN